MPRVKYNVARKKRVKKVLKKAKGQYADRSKQYLQAKRSLMHGMVYATRDRKNRKRDFRRLWIVRINAACRQFGLTYTKFMHSLKKAKIALDRKTLAELAVNDMPSFKKIVEMVKTS